MLNEGTTDYPRALTEKQMHDDSLSLEKPSSDQLMQKWIGMIDRCLEQQWKDSQQLLRCTKALKETNALINPSIAVKKLSDLGLEMMQRSIDMRQELVDNAYAIDLLEQPVKNSNRCSECSDHCAGESMHIHSNSDWPSGAEISSIKPGDPSYYIYLPSSPESDVYEPLITKIHAQSAKDNEHKRLSDSSDIGSYHSPFTLHSKLWQHHRLHQKHSDSLSLSSSSPSSITSSFAVSATSSTLHTLSSPRHNNGKANLRTLLTHSPSTSSISQDGDVTIQQHEDKTKSIPTSAYDDSPLSSSLSSAQATTSDLDIQCDQCFFWPRQRSLSLGELAGSVNSKNSPRVSISCHTAATMDQDSSSRTSSSPAPTIPIPIRTSSSLDTAVATPFIIQLPKATVSTPILQANTMASHITPSATSSSVVHTMSSKFNFKRNMAHTSKKKHMIPTTASTTSTPTAFSHHRTAAAIDSNDNTNDSGRSNKFVRSFITRKVSFPAIFTSKKVHPTSSDTERSNGLFI